MDETIRLPEIWNGWKVSELIGSGAYGNVFRAEYTGADPKVTERSAAVKIIRIPSGKAEAAALAHEMPDPADQLRYYENVIEGLGAEIRAMETLRNNPNVVKLQDYCVDHPEGTLQWTIYIRMELLTPFPKYVITHQMTEREVLRLGLSVCSALEECEAHGILHRDIKPENIMVSEDGIYKLGDFGVARQMDLTTGSLSLKGTFTYMAPEVYHGEKYDAKADQYSLGLVLYRLLNRNRDPFLDPDTRMVYYKDRESALQKRMRGEALPKPVDASENTAAVILKACAYRKEDRYSRISDFKEDLMICAGTKKRKRVKKKAILPVLIGAAAAVLVIVLAVSGLFGGDGQKNGDSAAGTSAAGGTTDSDVEGISTKDSSTQEEKTSAEVSEEPSSPDTEEPFSGEEAAEEVTENGTCGENLTWKLAGDTLTISGTGEMETFRILGHPSPWDQADFSKVVIEEGVTSISSYAFHSNWKVTNISLPDSLVRIEDHALDFWNLNSITIPKNVSYFGTGNLSSLDLNAIAVDPGNTVYDSRNSCNALIETETNTLVEACSNTVIPDTVTAIGPEAFSDCTGLTRIVIPDSVVSIDSTAFDGRENDLVIIGSAGSAAEKYADAHNIAFQAR